MPRRLWKCMTVIIIFMVMCTYSSSNNIINRKAKINCAIKTASVLLFFRV